MRKIIYFFLATILLVGVTTSCDTSAKKDITNYKITITVTNGDNNMAILSKRDGSEMVNLDSVKLVKGVGTISGNIGMPELYYIMFSNSKVYVPVFISAGDIVVNVDMQNPRNPEISGSSAQDMLNSYYESVGAFDQQASLLNSLYGEARKNNNIAKMDSIEEAYMSIEDKKTDFMLNFAKQNNNNVVPAFLVLSNSYKFELDALEKVVDGFDPSIDSSIYVKNLRKYISTLKRSEIGQPFIDFTLLSPDGNPISLASVVEKGNYLLVDFWASWCSPCRAENPNVVEAYRKYHDKGFDVFGVSFDKDHDKWVEAITADNLTWTHVSDLKYWNNAAGKLYGIQSIPQNILIDPKGIIIAKNLRGEALQKKLAELLTK